jgi:chromatin remodeling complex protein RSC6
MAKKTSKADKPKTLKKESKVVKTKKAPAKKTASKKTTPVVTEVVAPVTEEVTVNVAATEESSPETTSSGVQETVTSLFNSLIEQGESINSSHKLMVQLLKKTSKSYVRERRDYDKNLARERRRAKKDPNRKKREPSGFAVATNISDNLCDFLNVPKGTQLSRTDVTRKVTAYIREKNLQIQNNRRAFKPDKALKSILGDLQEVDKEKGFTYFNLQRYITPHITSSASSSSS